ncbi:SH3 domain-binding glutamic acid-rich protein homolog isoform X5 [Drosophila sulfurigaster albostrigata]|uniref:SH3 domain-binding glutamic acid-rich protein homolog isoform X5 n=1 Tax=Drosophila sulfurigaster albostrigata TaxID=89887 RepID=UPI002D21B222|nr:SH3 domain-binding glutamic acid-rich protein homolog isoform X5 [Drosophila sulfurigaster albostrigata]
MVLKVYVSGMSGNKEVKKRQQRVLMILDSKCIQYDTVDITEPGKESEKELMQNKSTSNGGTVSDPEPRHPLPPQIFNDEEYCGDYDAFDMANEIDTLEVFLKLAPADTTAVSSAQIELKQENGDAKEGEKEKEEEKEAGGDGEEKAPAEGEAEVEKAEQLATEELTAVLPASAKNSSSDSASAQLLDTERAATSQ